MDEEADFFFVSALRAAPGVEYARAAMDAVLEARPVLVEAAPTASEPPTIPEAEPAPDAAENEPPPAAAANAVVDEGG